MHNGPTHVSWSAMVRWQNFRAFRRLLLPHLPRNTLVRGVESTKYPAFSYSLVVQSQRRHLHHAERSYTKQRLCGRPGGTYLTIDCHQSPNNSGTFVLVRTYAVQLQDVSAVFYDEISGLTGCVWTATPHAECDMAAQRQCSRAAS